MERNALRPIDLVQLNTAELVSFGDVENLEKALAHKRVGFIYDADGIIVNLPASVVPDFNRLTGLKYHPSLIENWKSLQDEVVMRASKKHLAGVAQNGWYDVGLVKIAPAYIYGLRLAKLTLGIWGPANNFVLTARTKYPELAPATREWFSEKLPKMRTGNIKFNHKKGPEVAELAMRLDWLVYFEDSSENIEDVLAGEQPVKNCTVVQVPLGKIQPDFFHDQLIVVNRYPQLIQEMYPAYRLVKEAAERAGYDVAQY